MPRLIPLLCLLLAFAPTARARVFETYEECLARYGKPVTTTKTNIGSNVTFEKNRITVTVEFRKEKAVSISYAKALDLKKPNENRAFSPEETDRLLELNGAGAHKWAKSKKDMHGNPYWVTEDKALNAKLTGNTLRIEDGEEFVRRAKDVPPPVKPADRDLEGF